MYAVHERSLQTLSICNWYYTVFNFHFDSFIPFCFLWKALHKFVGVDTQNNANSNHFISWLENFVTLVLFLRNSYTDVYLWIWVRSFILFALTMSCRIHWFLMKISIISRSYRVFVDFIFLKYRPTLHAYALKTYNLRCNKSTMVWIYRLLIYCSNTTKII